jgi:hypothetical protein
MIDPTKPIFKTRDIADILGVSTEYVRQQVHEGKLHATTMRLSHHRTVFRFTIGDVRDYDADAARRLEESWAA